MKPIAVLGTGMAGFGAAHALEAEGVPFVCYDRNSYYGGHTASFQIDGFLYDEGGHISFTKDERLRLLLAKNIGWRHEEPRIRIDNYWQGHRIRHPVQCNLNALPTDVAVRVLKDFIAAQNEPWTEIVSYADWLYAAYGKTFAETFPMVYGRKYHTLDADQMTTDWLGPRMYRPDLEEILHGALAGQQKVAHYVDSFRYPTRGGFQAYLAPFAARFELRLGHELVGLDSRNQVLRFANGASVAYGEVISSIPLPELVPHIDAAPAEVVSAARRLAYTTTVLVNVGVNRADLSENHITYFYDEDVIFSRINFPHMFSPQNAPPGAGCIQAELYFSEKYKPLREPPEALVDPVIRDLRRCGIVRERDELLFRNAHLIPFSNVIYDHERRQALETVHAFLDEIGVHYCGRYGDWNHAWTDEAFQSGESAARAALEGR